jgi:two-component system, sensor histidine kinase
MKWLNSTTNTFRRSIYLILLALLTILWAYSGYLFILSRADNSASARLSSQNYYYFIAQFSDSVSKAEIALLQYGAGLKDAGEVNQRFEVLQSKLALLSTPTDATLMLEIMPRYRENVEQIHDIVDGIAPKLADPTRDTSKLAEIANQFEAMRAPLNDLQMIVGDAEGRRRDELNSDYARRREMLMQSSVGATFVLLVLAWVFVTNARRVRLLGEQQRAALQRETEAALAAANAVNARNTFLGMIGHELRTPLQSITAAIDVLIERELEGTDKLLVDQLSRAADVLDAQMKDLTDFSRMEAGQLVLRKRVFNPYDVISAAVESVEERARRKQLHFEVSTVDEGTLYLSDPYRIQQIVTNLLSNAIKYTESGSVALHVTTLHGTSVDELSVTVEDTGPGIESGNTQQIFMPFTQLHNTPARRYEGIGMGLTIVKGLVDLLGGTIHVESTPGRGSTFVVIFPLEKVDASAQGAAKTSARSPRVRPPAQQRTVLVVDDQESVLQSLKAMLASRDVESVLAGGAKQALAALATQQFDAILVDINMPDVDGVTLAKQIQASGGVASRTPIIACSALAPELVNAEDRKRFKHYLMKPIRADILKVALDAAWSESDVPL